MEWEFSISPHLSKLQTQTLLQAPGPCKTQSRSNWIELRTRIVNPSRWLLNGIILHQFYHFSWRRINTQIKERSRLSLEVWTRESRGMSKNFRLHRQEEKLWYAPMCIWESLNSMNMVMCRQWLQDSCKRPELEKFAESSDSELHSALTQITIVQNIGTTYIHLPSDSPTIKSFREVSYISAVQKICGLRRHNFLAARPNAVLICRWGFWHLCRGFFVLQESYENWTFLKYTTFICELYTD